MNSDIEDEVIKLENIRIILQYLKYYNESPYIFI